MTSELYRQKASAVKGVESVAKNASDDSRYERRTSSAGDPYFVLKARNGEIISRSEMYYSTSAMENGIASVKANAPDARTVDTTG